MDAMGPATLRRIKAIKSRVEEVGRTMGIPEDRAITYVEIESRDRLTEEIHSLHADEKNWHKLNWAEIVQKLAASLSGLLKSEK